MPSSRFAAGALALLAHVLLWWMLTTAAPPPRHMPRPAAEPPVSWLRLLPAARPPAPTAPEPAVQAGAPAPKQPPSRIPERAPRPPPERALVYVPPAALGAPPPRAEALNDPRSNSVPRGATAGLAGLAGTEHRWAIEPMAGEGRSRGRHGRGCVEVHVARNAQLDPFNQSVSPTPKQVRACD